MVSYPRVAILGDSLATGRDASVVVNDFARLVVSGLQARNNGSAANYLIHGVGGITTGGMLANLRAFGMFIFSDLLVLEVSTNDFGHNVPLAQFQSDLASLCSYLITSSVAPSPFAFVLLSPWYDPAAVNGLNLAASRYRDAVVTEAATVRQEYPGMSVCAVDIGGICVQPGTHPLNTAVDTFHPNDYGHELIAQAVLGVI